MREIDKDLGRVYSEGEYYFLEKVFYSLYELMVDEQQIKKRARRNNFKVIGSNWAIEDNPHYRIEKIMNNGFNPISNKVRFVYKIKLDYLK